MSVERHVHKDAVSVATQHVLLDIVIDFGELREATVDHVPANECRAVLVEAVRHEQRNIVDPCVPGRSRQQDPPVGLCDLDETLHPGTRTNYPLLVKYEERVLDIVVVCDVVPGVDGENASDSGSSLSADSVLSRVAIPLQAVTLLGSCDHINIPVLLLLHVVGQGS